MGLIEDEDLSQQPNGKITTNTLVPSMEPNHSLGELPGSGGLPVTGEPTETHPQTSARKVRRSRFVASSSKLARG